MRRSRRLLDFGPPGYPDIEVTQLLPRAKVIDTPYSKTVNLITMQAGRWDILPFCRK
jgi:hypothetical protein